MNTFKQSKRKKKKTSRLLKSNKYMEMFIICNSEVFSSCLLPKCLPCPLIASVGIPLPEEGEYIRMDKFQETNKLSKHYIS